MSKKKNIIISVIIVIFALVYFSIISPIYENYKDATNVKNFTEDKENVFVNTFYGLFKINKGNNEISQVKKINDYIVDVVVDENDEKWLITYDDTLYSFKNEQKITKNHPPFKIDKNQYINQWENIKIDQLGTKWILVYKGAFEDELYSYDIRYDIGYWEKFPFPEKGLRDNMLIDKYDDILFPTSKKLLILENYGAPGDGGQMNVPRNWEWSETDYPSKDFTENKSFVDKEHNIWISGHSNGNYSLYRFEYPEFIKYNFNKEIKALDSDTNGKVWIATEDGIEILNEKNSLISKKEISKMFIDSNNKKWIEKYRSRSIECYDGKEWKSYDFEIFKHVVKDFFNNLF